MSVEPGERQAFTISTWPRRCGSPNSTEPTYARASSVALSTTSSAADVRGGRSEKYADTRSSSMRCRSLSIVERMRATPGDASRRRCASNCAWRGGSSARATTGSMRASRTSSADHTPCVAMRASTLSRATRARSGSRSGRRRLGDCGNTTSNAASACDRRDAGLPRYAQLAASTPSIVPPNGARSRYSARISRFDRCTSSCSARAICRVLSNTLRRPGRGGSRMRATCIVSVEPPDTTRPCRTHCPAARASAIGLMPGCL